MKFGVREIANVVMKAKSTIRLGNKVFYKDEPVIRFDSLKTSSLEGSATTVYAQGGAGNARLVAWEGEKVLTFNMEDALLSSESFSILSGAGLIQKDKSVGKTIQEVSYQTVASSIHSTLTWDEEESDLPDYVLISIEHSENQPLGEAITVKVNKDSIVKFTIPTYDEALQFNNFTEEQYNAMYGWDFHYSGHFGFSTSGNPLNHEDDLAMEVANLTTSTEFEDVILYPCMYWGKVAETEFTAWVNELNELDVDYDMMFKVTVTTNTPANENHITGYRHVIETCEVEQTNYNSDKDFMVKLLNSSAIGDIYLSKKNSFLISKPLRVNVETLSSEIEWIDNGEFNLGSQIIADYYTPIINKPVQIMSIGMESLSTNFYLEADTLFRDTNGFDHPATFTIPNCRVQSNFTMTMASSGDPSTFSFVLDAFPGYTRFDPTRKVLASLTIRDGQADLEDDQRTETLWAPGPGV